MKLKLFLECQRNNYLYVGHVLRVWFEGMPAAIGWPGGRHTLKQPLMTLMPAVDAVSTSKKPVYWPTASPAIEGVDGWQCAGRLMMFSNGVVVCAHSQLCPSPTMKEKKKGGCKIKVRHIRVHCEDFSCLSVFAPPTSPNSLTTKHQTASNFIIQQNGLLCSVRCSQERMLPSLEHPHRRANVVQLMEASLRDLDPDVAEIMVSICVIVTNALVINSFSRLTTPRPKRSSASASPSC